jgi:hypothetical protein
VNWEWLFVAGWLAGAVWFVCRRLFGPLLWVIVSEWCVPDSALRWGHLTRLDGCDLVEGPYGSVSLRRVSREQGEEWSRRFAAIFRDA